MSIHNFSSQKTKTYPPSISFDGVNGAVVWRQLAVERDISDQDIGLVPASFQWGWAAFVAGQGMVTSNMQLVSAGAMADQPKTPAGKTKKGEPAVWHGYAVIDAVFEQRRCLFEIRDQVTFSVMQDICTAHAAAKGIVIRYTGCESDTVDGVLMRMPSFAVSHG